MKILLVNPIGSNWIEGIPDYTRIAIRMAPIGILSLAAYLLEAGHQVKVHDCQNPLNAVNCAEVIHEINTFEPALVGFTAVTSSFMNAYFLSFWRCPCFCLTREDTPEV
ncbi:MAG: cobalamin-dependent protein [Candidatus Omnitrophica bacterium]|nr:cobalamin-dependent protein [Candidatus Omnitrophota bacterium]